VAAPTRTNRGTASLAYASQATATIVSPSITPGANALMCVPFYEFTTDSAATLVVSDTFTGTGAWSYINVSDTDTGNYYIARFAYAKLGASPGTGTITCTRHAGTFTMAMAAEFIEVAGYNTTTPVRQSTKGTATGSSATLTYTSTCLTDSLSFTGVTVDDGAAPTTPTGYTARNSFPLPASAVYGNSAEDLISPAQTIVWTGLGSYHAALYGVEVAAATSTTTNQAITATATGTPSVASTRRVLQAITAASTAVASMVRQAGKLVTTTGTATASFVRSVSKPITFTAAGTATFAKQAGKALVVAAAGTPSIVKSVGKIIARTASGAASIATTVLSGVITYFQTVAATATGTVSVAKAAAKAVTATGASTVSTIRRTAKAVTSASVGTAVATRQAGKQVTATAAGSATMARTANKVVTAIGVGAVTIRRAVAVTVTSVASGAATVVKAVAVTFTTVGSAVVSIVTALVGPVAATLAKWAAYRERIFGTGAEHHYDSTREDATARAREQT
jgi:hypothetical protein